MYRSYGFVNHLPYTQVSLSGVADTPFAGYQVSDPAFGLMETVTVSLAALPYYMLADLGSISDPLGGGFWNPLTHIFTESAISTGTPTAATLILDRLVYTPPKLAAGLGETVLATVAVDGLSDAGGPVRLETVTPPAITGTVANEPVAAGSTIRPFATAYVADTNFGYNTPLVATIELSDKGALTDADGLLSGNGLSKIGVGVYTLSGTSVYYGLSSLVFTPTAPAAGATRTTGFSLKIVDTQAGLTATDETTSVAVVGPAPQSVAPLLAGTWSGQTVAANATIKPFSAVTVSDANLHPLDAATLTVSGGGMLGGSGVSGGAHGVYTVAATSPQALSGILNGLVYTPPALGSGQASNTINIRLDVTDGSLTATDNATLINEVATAAPPPVTPSANDTVVMAGAGLSITDAAGNVWAIDSLSRITVNGVADLTTGRVVELAYVNGTLWQENADNLWWGKTSPSDPWSPDNGRSTSPLPADPAPSSPAALPSALTVLDTTIMQPMSAATQPYSGPVAGLTSEYINVASDSLNITATSANWFIHAGSGNDAIAVSSGTNVLDGNTGSNFLTGGTGHDTFFVDDRSATADIWSSVANFHTGDAATIWGVTPNDFTLAWHDAEGATGYTGLTLHATAAGKATASLTLAGFSSADLTNGRLTVSYGTTAGATGSAYMNVQAN